MNIQWYPGHMTKAKRAMQESIKLIDLIIELVDARVPLSSRNPDLDVLGKGKARLILLNKSDMADERYNDAWTNYFKDKGFYVIKVNSRSGAGLKQINSVVQEACREKIERDRKRGILNRPVRAMVAGIPNVGKSTFINSFAGKACAKTGNKPGVTKGNQWIRLNKALELLDTPGILWPKFEDQQVGLKLAFIGSINDEILNKEELASELILFLMNNYPKSLNERYQLDAEQEAGSYEDPSSRAYAVLAGIAKARGCLLKGNEYDTSKAANLLLDDFRSGRLGRITLEFPEAAGEI
ncbi:ribosome biogenesis GTPase YlqF [Clostridium sp. AM58-1XD]|uniref:ribosome biogenesis GTPase YlqF n=1 Tax=Clostridium sp. AM58-1XD TaxID=2292307 RepID=UPI000E4F3755|nr:ribosome biogenesis GTPase YlqF [Clostridium sp. AM58-1XD]RGZ01513.1 ribosome biogenesis GTPase YlqF [Clostridium sp. AM58-1XD]